MAEGDKAELLRVVDVVLLRLSYDNRILIETHEEFRDGRQRETFRLPGGLIH
jgi:hypothetical protein